MWCGRQVSPSVSIAGNRYILPAPGPLELVMAVVAGIIATIISIRFIQSHTQPPAAL